MSGTYVASPGSGNHGFIGDGEHFTTIDVPGALGTTVHGLNDLGQVVGLFGNSSGGNSGFVYDSESGDYTIFDIPGSNSVNPFGINNLGDVTGYHSSIDGQQGFLMSDFSFADIRVPSSYEGGTTLTVPYGINDLGQIVGDYTDSAPVVDVPEPEVLWLFFVGLLGLGLRPKNVEMPLQAEGEIH